MNIKAIDFDKMKCDVREAILAALSATMPTLIGDLLEDVLMPWIASFTSEYAVIELGYDDYWQVPYTYDEAGAVTVSPQADWLKVEPMKTWIEAAKAIRKPAGFIKAIGTDEGEWIIELLVPYGGPLGGKDNDGDWFSAKTDFWLDQIGKRPIIHYHGWDANTGQPTNPEVIGEEVSYTKKSDGVWFKYILDKASATAKSMWEAAKGGFARASSGAISHLVRPLQGHGHIDLWPIVENSIMDIRNGTMPSNAYAVALPAAKAIYKAANLPLTIETRQENEMTLEEIEALLDKREAAKAEKQRIADLEARAARADELEAEIAEATKARTPAPGTEQIKRLNNPAPDGQPAQHISVSSKWDGFSLGQLGMAYDILKAKGQAPSMELYRAMHAKALKVVEAPTFYDNQITRDKNGYIQREFSPVETEKAVRAVKAINPMQLADAPAVKANELMTSAGSAYGDEWVPPMWSAELWDLVRNGAPVLSKFRQVEVPGESLTLPTLAGKTTVYKTGPTISQSTLTEAAALATMSKAATGQVVLTPVKGTAWVEWNGEFDENSIIPVLPSIQAAMQQDIAEQVDEILISGDTDATTNNISDNGNGSISASWRLLIADGLRDHALANSLKVDIGAAMDATKFLSVKRKLGVNSINMQKCFWIFDPGFYDTALALGEALTSEKRSSNVGTFEDGMLVRVYGAPISVSDRYGLTDSSGYINNTTNLNVKGSFLLVRADRWVVGFGRQIKIEALPRDRVAIITDTNGLFASFRLDFKPNGTLGCALGYDTTLVG